MPHPRFSSEEIVQRGEEFYERYLRERVEPLFEGKILVLDIETGDYEIDEFSLPAADRLRAKSPDAVLYAKRVGYDAVYALGGTLRRTKR